MAVLIDAVLRLPWDQAALPRSLVVHPPAAEPPPDARRSPEVPQVRVRGGAVSVLACYRDRYVPDGSLGWWRDANGTTTAARVPHPWGDGATTLAVDHHALDDGSLLLLETVATPDGDTSRLALVSPADTQRRWDALGGGPYERLVADDRGRVLIVARRNGATVVEVDVATGELARRAVAAPGTRAALAALRGAVVPSRLLDRPDPKPVVAPVGVPGALVHLFGVDGDGAYYTVVNGQLVSIEHDGRVRRRLTLADHEALAPADAGPGAIVARLALPAAWQVDVDGCVYVPRVDPDGVEILRVRF